MRKLYTTKFINRPEMKFYLVLEYTLPSTSKMSWLSYVTQNSFLFVSFDKEGIINVLIKTVLP